jgi:hypothetical protein
MKYQSQMQAYISKSSNVPADEVKRRYLEKMSHDIADMMMKNGEFDIYFEKGRESHPEHDMSIITLSFDPDKHIRTIWQALWQSLPSKYMFAEGLELLIRDVKEYEKSVKKI